jgi:hypothetical protein
VKAVNEPKKERKEKKPRCHEIEPNLSKDKPMREGDNPSFIFGRIYKI